MPTLKLNKRKYKFTGIVANQYKTEVHHHHCHTIAKPKSKKLPNAYVYKNLQILTENLSMTDHFNRQEHTDQKQEIEICCQGRKQNNFSMEVDESIADCGLCA